MLVNVVLFSMEYEYVFEIVVFYSGWIIFGVIILIKDRRIILVLVRFNDF